MKRPRRTVPVTISVVYPTGCETSLQARAHGELDRARSIGHAIDIALREILKPEHLAARLNSADGLVLRVRLREGQRAAVTSRVVIDAVSE